MAITAPQGIDYMEAGAKAIYENQARLREGLSTQDFSIFSSTASSPENYYDGREPLQMDMKINDSPYTFACRDLQNNQCIAETLANKEAIAALIQQNAILIERYLTISQLPYYSVDSYFYGVADIIPSYQTVIQSSDLRLAQAIIAFNSGHVDEGFTLLTQERAFAQRMLEEDKALIGKMIAIRMIYTQFNTLSNLLGTPVMQAYLDDVRLQALLAPLSDKAQRGLATAFETERNMGLYLFYALTGPQALEIQTITEPNASTQPTQEQIDNYAAHYNRYISTKFVFLQWQPYIEQASLNMEEVSQQYVTNQLQVPYEATEKQLAALLALPGNEIGNILLETAAPNPQIHLHRFYDVQTYMALVNLKRQIINAKISTNDVTAFLEEAGAMANNPYTQRSFDWDAQNHLLSAPWLSVQGSHNPKGETQMHVFINTP